MKNLLYILLLSLNFFIIHCGPMDDEEALQTDILFGDTQSQSPNQNSSEVTAASKITTAIEETGENAQLTIVEDGEPSFKDFTLELSVAGDSVENETGPKLTGGEGFEADAFQSQQFHSCTKEGEKTYIYELFEEPEESPYTCFLIHRYRNCGKSWDPEKGYCYENSESETSKNFCQVKLDKYLTKRKEDGYECVEQVKEENEEGHPENSDSATIKENSQIQQPTGAEIEGIG